jgi:hypothetical protein
LQADDVLHRVIEPGAYDEEGPFRAAFEDTGRDRRTGQLGHGLSFLVSARAALRALANRRTAKERCGTGKEPPSPERMYEEGYRVAGVPAASAMDAVRNQAPVLSFEADADDNEVSGSGHVNLIGGNHLADTWALESQILTREETLKL